MNRRGAMKSVGCILLFLTTLLPSLAFAQNGLTLLGHFDHKHGTSFDNVSYSASWGYVAPDGREYAIVGTYTGTQIVDITNTDSLREIVHISGPSSIWREMRTYKNRAYVVSEGGGGVQIIDLSHLPTSASLIRAFRDTSKLNSSKHTNKSHTIEIFDGYMYLNGCANWSPSGVLIYSLAKPDSPKFVGEYQPEYIHDCYVKGSRLYAAAINSPGGLNIADITDKAAPSHITKITYPGAGTHNAWTTTNGQHVITTDEIGSTPKTLKIWNVSSIPPAPSSPYSTYSFNPIDIEHNIFIRGRYGYVAWYDAGIVVVDLINPGFPATAGSYDTSPLSGSEDGVWAVYPFFWSGKVTAGDMQNGLYVFRFNGLQPRTPVALKNPRNQQLVCDNNPITFEWTRVADPSKDPHTYTLTLKGPSIDTTYTLASETTFTCTNTASLANGNYKWFVNTKDEVNDIASRDTFTIVRGPRSLSLLLPNGGECWNSGDVHTITWSAGCVADVDLSLSTDAGNTWQAIVTSVPGSEEAYSWSVPHTPSTQCLVRVRDASDSTLQDVSNAIFTIQRHPSLMVNFPNGGELLKAGITASITWTFKYVDSLELSYSSNNGLSWNLINSSVPSTPSAYSWLVPGSATAQGLIRLRNAADSSLVDVSDAPFTIFNSASLHVLSPNGGERWREGSPQTISWTSQFTNRIALDYSTNGGAAWIVILADTPATTTSYQCVAPIVNSSDMLVRVRDVSNSLAFDVSDAPFTIFPLTIDVEAAWNLVSIPVHPLDVNSSTNFPGAVSLPFSYDPAYRPNSIVQEGIGYWVKYSTPATLNMMGALIDSETVPLKPGWNLIGSISDPIPVIAVQSMPPGNLLTGFFKFNPSSGYALSDSIHPGNGYWIKASSAGALLLSNSSGISPTMRSRTIATHDYLGMLNELRFEDAQNRTISLYFGKLHGEIPSTFFELPPRLPEEVFDVRFTSQRTVESSENENIDADIQLRGIVYPLTISNTLHEDVLSSYRLVERSGSRIVKLYDLVSQSTIILQTPPIGRFSLEVDSHPGLPKSVYLHQNYPNPFNPATVIHYDLPEASLVTLKVFNTLGQEVRALVNEHQEGGFKAVDFDASSLTSGIYYYRLAVGSVVLVKKMLLMR